MARGLIEVLGRWVADNAHDTIVNPEFGDCAEWNAVPDEVGVRSPDFVVSHETAQRVDGDAAVGNNDDNSVLHPLLDVDKGGDEPLGGCA